MAGCGCGSAAAGTELWINVKADGIPTGAMPKSDAVASQQANGGYLKRANT